MPGETTVIVASIFHGPGGISVHQHLDILKSSRTQENLGMDPNRFVLVSAFEEIATFKNMDCIKLRNIFQDLNPSASEAVGPQYQRNLGWRCFDPSQSGIVIEFAYSNRSGVKEITSSFKAEAEDFFSGVQISEKAWLENSRVALTAAQAGDIGKALGIWKLWAELGEVEAQYNVGVLYAEGGAGVPQDFEEAVRWYKMAADQGDHRAMANLGMMYQDGRGVRQDYTEGARFLKAAAKNGNAPAQFAIALAYKNGEGVLKDNVQAVRWLLLAAKQGSINAQYALVHQYRTGRGVPLNQQTALMWYYNASTNGFNFADGFLEGVVVEMSYADIGKAQERSSVCLESNYTDCGYVQFWPSPEDVDRLEIDTNNFSCAVNDGASGQFQRSVNGSATYTYKDKLTGEFQTISSFCIDDRKRSRHLCGVPNKAPRPTRYTSFIFDLEFRSMTQTEFTLPEDANAPPRFTEFSIICQ